jgi:hypothetical protein
MTVQLEAYQLFIIIATVIGAFWAIAQMLIKGSQEHLADKFTAVTDLIKAQSRMIEGQGDDMRRIERDLMGLKAELPRDYVRREDYTQTIATIMTKIDHATLLMQQAVRDAYAQAAKANPKKDHQE